MWKSNISDIFSIFSDVGLTAIQNNSMRIVYYFIFIMGS